MKRNTPVFLLVLSALLGAILLAIATGRYPIHPCTLLDLVASQVGLKDAERLLSEPALVLWSVRMPRILMAIMTGAALSVAGVIFQGLFRNPLVSPGILGVTDKSRVDGVLHQALKEELVKELYERLNHVESYFDTVDYFASLTGREERAQKFRHYVSSRLARIQERTHKLSKPAVYCSLGHPLIAMFDEKMESRLITMAGGELANRMIQREDRPGNTISGEQFRRMAPEIIIVSRSAAWPVEKFVAWCAEHDLSAPALTHRRVFHLYPYRASTNPAWILGLMCLANIIHPETFHYDLQQEADEFCRDLYGAAYDPELYRTFPGLRLRHVSTSSGHAPH